VIARALGVVLCALTAAVVAGHFLAADPGFVVIGYGGKVVRTSFAFFLLASVCTLGVLYLLARLLAGLFDMRRRWRRWSAEYRRRRAHRSLANGMLAYAGGDYARAERLFSGGVDEDAQPAVHYLAAAEAAHAQHAYARRDNYLQLAHDIEPQTRSALDTQHAEWLIERREFDAAAALIARTDGAQTPALLRLRLGIAQGRGDHGAVLRLLPELRRERVLRHDEAMALERASALALLATGDADDAVWEQLSKPLRAHPAVVAAYARALIRRARVDDAERLVARQLDRNWDSDLAALYGEIACTPPTTQLRRAEAWATQHEDDPGLRLTRARIAARAQLWGPARQQLELLLAASPSPLYYRLLADIADATGDDDAARRLRAQGLELATGA